MEISESVASTQCCCQIVTALLYTSYFSKRRLTHPTRSDCTEEHILRHTSSSRSQTQTYQLNSRHGRPDQHHLRGPLHR